MPATAILDVGKTNIKLLVLDGAGRTVWSRSRRNHIIADGPYPHFEMEDTWQWILDALADAGIAQDKVLGISQGWRLGGAIKTTERKLAEGQLLHGGRAMMNWCVGNARVEPKGNSILITKQASGFAKIDPLMALFNAVSLMALNPASNVFDGELLTV